MKISSVQLGKYPFLNSRLPRANTHLIPDLKFPNQFRFRSMQSRSNFFFVLCTHFEMSHLYSSVKSVVVGMHEVIQDIYVSHSTFMSKVLPHFGFQSTIKSFDDSRFFVLVHTRKKVYYVLFDQFLNTTVQEFRSFVGLERCAALRC